MRRRLLWTFVSLLTVAVTALALPLAVAIAARDTQVVFIDRQADTARFAGFADPALRTGQTDGLSARLSTYDGLFGIVAAVFNRDGRLVLASRSDARLDAPGIADAIRSALAGEGSPAGQIVWPWQSRPLVIAEPVGHAGEIIGAVVTISPVGGIRSATLTGWTWVAAFALLALLAAGYAARRLTGWILRPVLRLDEAAHAIAAGSGSARVPDAGGPVELRRFAQSFNTMVDGMQQLLERRRVFVSFAGHQLRNPLAALRLRVENLMPHLDDAAGEDHVLTLDEVDRLARVCDGLLALASVESGHPPQLAVADATRIAADRVAAWQPVAGRAEIRLVPPAGEPVAVLALDGTLDQVLDVLLDNAIKFAGAGATVVVTVGSGVDGVIVDVRDDGPGLPPEAMSDATLPYWRSPQHHRQPGTGLGLAIVATLLAAGGGDLVLRQAEPHGLHARVRLKPAP